MDVLLGRADLLPAQLAKAVPVSLSPALLPSQHRPLSKVTFLVCLHVVCLLTGLQAPQSVLFIDVPPVLGA